VPLSEIKRIKKLLTPRGRRITVGRHRGCIRRDQAGTAFLAL